MSSFTSFYVVIMKFTTIKSGNRSNTKMLFRQIKNEIFDVGFKVKARRVLIKLHINKAENKKSIFK